MEDSQIFTNVLGVFAHYGFKKASMEDLAQAQGVTRQTLYNRFKSKEAILDWAVEGYVGHSREKAAAELKDDNTPAETCLLNAFCRWVGDIVPLLHNSPHGTEVMDMGNASLKRSNIDHHSAFENDLVRFLLHRGVCKTHSEATEITYLLIVSSKGLLLKTGTSEEFQDGMARIIRTAIKGPAFS